MTNINKVVLAGRLTRDPNLSYSAAGLAIMKVGMAVNERREKNGQWVDIAVFVNVTMFGKRGEAFAKYHKRGSECCFPDAKLGFNSWEKDGVKRSELYVIANGWEFIGAKDPVAGTVVADEDTPF